MGINNVVHQKIDIFMQKYVIGKFDLNSINWVFSISGGKDSFTMAKAIQQWYENSKFSFHSTGMFIDQWNDDVKDYIISKFNWLDNIVIFDAKNITQQLLSTSETKQAPCRGCSNIRHDITDKYISENLNNGMYNFVCRGLHLTDMSVSMLWRYTLGYKPYESLNGKGLPIVQLCGNGYLVKPLSYVREYESQIFCQNMGYIPVHCNCQALKFPSRRDIIEESVLINYKSDLWEFDIPEMDKFINNTLKFSLSELKACSFPGRQIKENIIEKEFYNYTLNYLKNLSKNIDLSKNIFNFEIILDEIGIQYLNGSKKGSMEGKIPLPKLFSGDTISEFETRMICTMGPFWGAIGLHKEFKDRLFNIQNELFDINFQNDWSQTIKLLEKYFDNHK